MTHAPTGGDGGAGSGHTSVTPYGRPDVTDDDIAAVVEVLRSGWLTTGPKVAAFEAALSMRFDGAETVVCNSGTAALHMAYQALGIGPGDIVIVPALTFLATANAVRYLGAEVAFCDSDPETGLANVDTIRAAYEKVADKARVRAVAVVHLNGQSADMAAVSAFARLHGLAVVEDACHALGAMQAGDADDALSPVGACRHSDACVFSFHAVKTITTGEGGAVSTRTPGLAARMRHFRNHGIRRDPVEFEDRDRAFDASGAVRPWYYEMAELGWNYRLSDIGCALGISQLQRLDAMVAERERLYELYKRRLAEWDAPAMLVPSVPSGRPAWHLAAVRIDFECLGVRREAVMAHLAEGGFGSQVHYIPVHTQPYYRNRYGVADLPGATRYYESTLTLPLFVGLEDDAVAAVCHRLAEALGSADGVAGNRQQSA